MTKQETINKLKEIVKEFERESEKVNGTSVATWEDFEIEKFIIVGRPGKNLPYSPVFCFDTDLGVLRAKEVDKEEIKKIKARIETNPNKRQGKIR